MQLAVSNNLKLKTINLKLFVLFLRLKFILFILAIVTLCYNCAKISAPVGGPKDETPPKILESTPENKSINFKGKKISLFFNEFIQINNLQKSFNISPPLKEIPEFKMKGKNLIINLDYILRDSTTYTLSFGDGIADLNENNPIKNFQFVFSTGPNLDSMSITGIILDAFTLKPVEGFQIMLHDNLSDSAPGKCIPMYIDKVEKTGTFSLNNLKSGTYNIYAIKDANNNMKFDLANEKFGFLDSSVTTEVKITEVTDTMKNIKKKDSIVTHKKIEYFPKNIRLLAFEEETNIQFMTNNDRPENVKCFFTFNKPLANNPEIKPLNFSYNEPWYISEKNKNNDTIIYWLKDTITANIDTMKFEIKYPKPDSSGKLIIFTDTVILKIKPKSKTSKTNKPQTKLTLKPNIINNAMLDLNLPVTFLCGHPVSSFDTAYIKLYLTKDSTEIIQQYSFASDSTANRLIDSNPRKFNLTRQWQENKSYKIKIYPGAFTDIYGYTNDTTLITFKTQKKDFYCSLLIKLKNVNSSVILQLLDAKETVLKQTRVSSDKDIKFEYLQPSKYNVKVIYDSNNNGRWDSGNFSKKLQPEKVLYFNTELNIRTNWDMEQEWKIE